MFTYRCPACGKHHVTESSFEKDFQTKCLRCGESIHVTEELVHMVRDSARARSTTPALEEAITTRTAKKNDKSAGGEAPEKNLDEDPDGTIEVESEDDAVSSEDKAPKRRSLLDTLGQIESELGPDVPELEVVESSSYGLLDEDDESKPRTGKSKRQPEKASKTKAKADQKNGRRGEEEDEDSEDLPPESAMNGLRSRWPIIAGIAALVLVVAGVGGYLALGGKKKKTDAPVAKKTDSSKPKSTSKPPAKDKTKPPDKDKKTKQPDPPPTLLRTVVYLSAPRLSAELTADAAGTNRKYADAPMEVTGLFEKIETIEPGRPPARPHLVFAGSGRPIRCDISGDAEKLKLGTTPLLLGESYTVKGVYSKDGFLRDCKLCPLAPPADAKYKGKEVEVVGFVEGVVLSSEENSFPAIKLEGRTNRRASLQCLFRTTDEAEVKKVRRTSLVTIKGTCSGRERQGDSGYRITLHNCQIVYTSAPVPPTPRVDANLLVSEYEEDLQRIYLPPGKEERIDAILPVTHLSKEITADSKIVDKKYRNKLLIVSGRPSKQTVLQNSIVLESVDTDKPLKVQCVFTARNFPTLDTKTLDTSSDFIVCGVCSGMIDEKTLRLDNCEVFDPDKGKEFLRLTSDLVPHTSGKSFIYDVVNHVTLGRKKPDVLRITHIQGKKGITETLTTHAGSLDSKSLFDEGEPEKWFSHAKKCKVPLPGPSYLHQLSGGFIEIGQPGRGDDGRVKIVWEPVLKVGLRAGQAWVWTLPQGEKKYVVTGLVQFRGLFVATIQETFTPAGSSLNTLETEHVYVQGVGEVQRRQWGKLSSTQRQLLTEIRLVDKSIADLVRDAILSGEIKVGGDLRNAPSATTSPPLKDSLEKMPPSIKK